MNPSDFQPAPGQDAPLAQEPEIAQVAQVPGVTGHGPADARGAAPGFPGIVGETW